MGPWGMRSQLHPHPTASERPLPCWGPGSGGLLLGVQPGGLGTCEGWHLLC